MTIISFCNHKGGTGKTTSVLNVSAAFALRGARVLVIDLDPQGFLTRMMGVEEPPVKRSSMMLFAPEVDLKDVSFYQTKAFDLLPSSARLTRLMRKLVRPIDVFWVKEALTCLEKYDLVFIDTAAAVTVYSLNALVASHGVIIPVTPEYQSVVGAEQAFRTAKMIKEKLQPKLVLPLFLFTQVDARKRAHQVLRHYISDRYTGRILNRLIRTSTNLAQTGVDGTSIFSSAPKSRGAVDYANVADELWNFVEANFSGFKDPALAEVQDQPKIVEDETNWSNVIQFLEQQEV